jgi:hypothetical protein
MRGPTSMFFQRIRPKNQVLAGMASQSRIGVVLGVFEQRLFFASETVAAKNSVGTNLS